MQFKCFVYSFWQIWKLLLFEISSVGAVQQQLIEWCWCWWAAFVVFKSDEFDNIRILYGNHLKIFGQRFEDLYTFFDITAIGISTQETETINNNQNCFSDKMGSSKIKCLTWLVPNYCLRLDIEPSCSNDY